MEPQTTIVLYNFVGALRIETWRNKQHTNTTPNTKKYDANTHKFHPNMQQKQRQICVLPHLHAFAQQNGSPRKITSVLEP